MFKRIEKKQKKREREEELGLDDEARQMFGLNDTDSDESSSSSSASSSSESGSSDGSSSDNDSSDREPASDMKTEWLAADDADSGSDDSDEEGGGIDLNEAAFKKPNLTIKEAVQNPIYLSRPDKDWHGCIVCPKKRLKCSKQVELHLASAGHVRRFQKFTALANSKKYVRKKDPMLLVTAISQDQRYVANAQGLTKRSRRRQIKLEKLKKKRELKKQIIERKKRKRAKKEAPDGKNDNDAGRESASQHDKSTSERPQKRRKILNNETSNEKGGVDNMGTGDQNMPTQIGKTNAKAKSKTKGKKHGEGGKGDAVGSQSEPKSKTETVPQASVEASKSIAAISGDAAAPVKRRDEQRIKTKGHVGKAGAGRFAKLSDTRAVKDKSTRKARPEGKDRSSISSKNPSRYFDAPEDAKSPKGIGPTETPLKKSKRPKKGNEDEQTGKSGSKRRRTNTKEDLAIFD